MSGEVFAGYRIVRQLGSGGMGEVYLAQHPRLPRQDALKILRSDLSKDGCFRERFIREADLAAGLWHPHIVGVHDRGEHDGHLWIAMDYVNGRDAARLLQQRYPAGMPSQSVADIITAVGSALDYAHKRALLHRDVKPANIMLSEEDEDSARVVLSDFGIARPVDDISGLTATNMTVGTVAYAAPEQLLGEHMDGRADQYALAATAYQLLTGAPLFLHSNPAVVISRHLNTPPPPLAAVLPELSPLDSVFEVALAKNPEHRFDRCADFAEAFRDQLTTRGAGNPSAPTVHASAPRKEKTAQIPPSIPTSTTPRAWIKPAIAGLVLLVVVCVALFVWQPWRSDQPPTRSSPIATPDTSTVSPAPPPPSVATASPPPPPPIFPASSVDRVLLSASQLTSLLDIHVSDDPASGAFNGLARTSSSYGTSDHAEQVTPRACVGVVFTGEHDVYGDTGFEAIKTQTFGNLYGNSDPGPDYLQQTGAVFATAEHARQFFTATQQRWDACRATDVDATLGFENGRSLALGPVNAKDDLISVTMASNDGLNGPNACQQALGVRNNVVAESRTCAVPSISTPYDPTNGWERNPGWASPDAERVVEAMIANVLP